ncbi:hydroxyphenylacetyl-CoA thioesterase PaaI [Shimia abyssi]|uniref:hydroxyphenylacetyl-CoA thioesterase PaaI n=1 Tax=Shimia abyssi TaxID=1662395 RepID=UPI000D0D22FF|nr:hydroxyphenylacetyl-CoA thioesterase PaaI [Shimia abyssi]
MTPEERAKKAAAAMWAEDRASRFLGMEIIEMAEGRAVLQMVVRPEFCNGHGIGHGGLTFSLADSAFAFACNSRNQATVAQHNSISYVAPAREGDVLTAVAQEISLTGRSGIYDVRVSNQDGAIVAEFRGASRAITGHLFEE